MKCSECKFCKELGRAKKQKGCYYYSRKTYMCENPKVYELKDKYGYQLNNFVGYGDTTYESPLQLKTTKKWCPLREENNNG